ncbi:efflux RND transporter periplasmic adaptor subunit [Adhaeribacter swui]|uniref:Efflux RND transporter periplasmic adaptor subunit n=1 Tax=Adhaeribacter swui TaxID=2086471 RepID=A0A7G7GCD4_9BACT|nr:efflux RND transporter periplasmic adaptor subunit [Adhaeribacter swui]QNF34818.1 efflux RND transporter periplasmic adaptor subunit [Adhaeribacter swui]
MKRKVLFSYIAFFVASYTLSSCHSTPTVKVEPPTSSFCLNDSLATNLKLDTALMQPVQNELTLSGKVDFDEKGVFKIFPLVGGQVLDVKADLGDFVEKGQILAVIKSGEIADYEKQLIDARANLQLASKNLDVAQDMFKAGLTSERDLIAAQKEHQNAQADIQKIQEIFKIYNISRNSEYVVKAPASGFIAEKRINRDTQIRSDDANNIFTISSMNQIWVMANVYETDISKIESGQDVEVTTLSYPDKIFRGKIDKTMNIIDPETRVMKVRIRMENPDYLLKPEMFTTVRVKYGYPDNEKLITIPSQDIIFDNSRNFVVVYRKKCDVEVREVEIFKTSGAQTYIKSGLKEGEKLISQNQLLVYNALNS